MKIFVFFFGFLCSLIAYARPSLDRAEVCYLFDGDELKSRGVCVVYSNYGAGGGYIGMDYKDKKYLFEYEQGENDNIWSNKVYYRDVWYNKVENEDEFFKDNFGYAEYLVCFENKPYDICYTHIDDYDEREQ